MVWKAFTDFGKLSDAVSMLLCCFLRFRCSWFCLWRTCLLSSVWVEGYLFFPQKNCCGSACGLMRFVGRGGIAAPRDLKSFKVVAFLKKGGAEWFPRGLLAFSEQH